MPPSKPKKVSANWYIAATHYLTAGFVVPFIGGLIVAVALGQLKITDATTVQAISFIASLAFIYLGVLYASRYVNKTYSINDPRPIVNLATIYLVVLRGGFLAALLSLAVQNGAQIDSLLATFGFVEILISAILFYILSKKYIVAGT